VERPSPLQYVSSTQLNYIVPAGTATGLAKVTIATGGGLVLSQPLDIQTVFPIVFQYPYDASVDYQPRPVAQLVRLRNGEQTVELVTRQIDMGPDSDQVFLVLFGTGLRHRTSLASVRVTLRAISEDLLVEVDAPVEYAGPQNEFAGLDQVNVRLPRSLVGAGAQERGSVWMGSSLAAGFWYSSRSFPPRGTFMAEPLENPMLAYLRRLRLLA
jgi:uncharacterized protein (TIGR03437 family)